MGLYIKKCAKEISDKYNSILNNNSYNGDCTLLRTLEQALDKNFQSASPSLENIDITTPKGSLNFGSCKQSDVSTMASRIGKGVADYWAKTIEPTGTPQGCKKIVAVTNTASSIASTITSQLLSAADNVESLPPYSKMVNIIITSVKTIVWTVTESDSDCSSTFTVTIS